MGMSVEELYDMIPRVFWNKLSGFFELELRRERQNWERERWSTCLLLNIQLPKGKRIKPTQLLEFENEKKAKQVDVKKLKERAEFIKKMEEFKNKE